MCQPADSIIELALGSAVHAQYALSALCMSECFRVCHAVSGWLIRAWRQKGGRECVCVREGGEGVGGRVLIGATCS